MNEQTPAKRPYPIHLQVAGVVLAVASALWLFDSAAPSFLRWGWLPWGGAGFVALAAFAYTGRAIKHGGPFSSPSPKARLLAALTALAVLAVVVSPTAQAHEPTTEKTETVFDRIADSNPN